MADKRSLRRIRRRLSLRFGIDAPVRMAFTEDVTDRGMFIKTTNLYPPGTKIAIELIMPDETRVRIVGSIRWSKKVPPNMIHLVRKAGLGIKILSIETGEEHFRRFLQEAQTVKNQPLEGITPSG